MRIDPYISELLYDHDCVIVTDFGGFIANYKEATINPALHMLVPPSKRLAFNSSLNQNDGLLANYISRKAAMNYQDACDVIREYVKELNQNLKEGQKVKLEKIGVLYLDADRNIQFVPDQHTNYLIESYGFTPVHAPVIRRETVTEQQPEPVAVIRKLKPAKESTTSAGDHKKWKLLEVIPAAAALAVLLMMPPVLSDLNKNLATMLPFSRVNEFIREWQQEEPVPVFDPKTISLPSPFDVPPPPSKLLKYEAARKAAEANVAEAKEELAVAETTAVEVKIPSPAMAVKSVSENQGRVGFYIIGGCFKSKENAEKYVSELKAKQYEAEIIGKNKAGLFMVSVFSSASSVQTADALANIKAEVNANAWIFHSR